MSGWIEDSTIASNVLTHPLTQVVLTSLRAPCGRMSLARFFFLPSNKLDL